MPIRTAIFVTFCTLLVSEFGRAQLVENPQKYRELFGEVVVELKNLTPEKYMGEIAGLRGKALDYLEYKLGTCRGDFTKARPDESSPVKEMSKKQRREERKRQRKACYTELGGLHRNYLNSYYLAHGRYLKNLYERQLEQLNKEQKSELKRVEKLYRF